MALLLLWRVLSRPESMDHLRYLLRLGVSLAATTLGALLAIFLLPAVGIFRDGTVRVPAPHELAPRSGGLAYSPALVRDTLQQRYFQPGSPYYQRRIAEARERIGDAMLRAADPSQAAYDAMDDLSVALDYSGAYAEAVAVQEAKQRFLETRPESQRYTAHANLGTHLAHRHMSAALAGDWRARAEVERGLEHLREAVRINPDAHFGRERWQVLAVENLLAVARTPDRLLQHDLFGQPLAAGPARPSPRLHDWRPLQAATRGADLQAALLNPDLDAAARTRLRHAVPRVPTGYGEVAFDEPLLAAVGMWQAGGGPSPHLALCMATTLEAIGELPLAWQAYERARLMPERFSPDPAIRLALTDHCEARQAAIVTALGPEASAALAAGFAAGLRRGQDWQAAQARYDARQVGRGISTYDLDFHDGFLAEAGTIASRAEAEEGVTVLLPGGRERGLLWRQLPVALLLGSVLGFAAACLPY